MTYRIDATTNGIRFSYTPQYYTKSGGWRYADPVEYLFVVKRLSTDLVIDFRTFETENGPITAARVSLKTGREVAIVQRINGGTIYLQKPEKVLQNTTDGMFLQIEEDEAADFIAAHFEPHTIPIV